MSPRSPALREGRRPELENPLHQGPEIDLTVPALIPDDYVPDVHIRLVMYKRIAGAGSDEELRELQVEMIDRFGLLPPPLRNLFRVTGLKLRAVPMGVTKIEVGRKDGRMLFGPDADIDTRKLVELLQGEPGRYRFEGGNRLRLSGDFEQEELRFTMVAELLSTLAPQDKTQHEQTTPNG